MMIRTWGAHLSDPVPVKPPSTSVRKPSGNRSVNKRREGESEKESERTGIGDGRRGVRS